MSKQNIEESVESRVCFEELEDWVREKIQGWVQELLEEEVTELLGRRVDLTVRPSRGLLAAPSRPTDEARGTVTTPEGIP